MNLRQNPQVGDDPLILGNDAIDRLKQAGGFLWVSVQEADGKEVLAGVLMADGIYEQILYKASEFERVRMVANLIDEEAKAKSERPYHVTKMGFGF